MGHGSRVQQPSSPGKAPEAGPRSCVPRTHQGRASRQEKVVPGHTGNGCFPVETAFQRRHLSGVRASKCRSLSLGGGVLINCFQVESPFELMLIPLLSLLFESFKPTQLSSWEGWLGSVNEVPQRQLELGGVLGRKMAWAHQGEAGTSSQGLCHGCPPPQGSRAGDEHQAGTPDEGHLSQRAHGMPGCVALAGPDLPRMPGAVF